MTTTKEKSFAEKILCGEITGWFDAEGNEMSEKDMEKFGSDEPVKGVHSANVKCPRCATWNTIDAVKFGITLFRLRRSITIECSKCAIPFYVWLDGFEDKPEEIRVSKTIQEATVGILKSSNRKLKELGFSK